MNEWMIDDDVRSSCPHNIRFPWFQRCCALSLELTRRWHSCLFFTTYFPHTPHTHTSPTFQTGLCNGQLTQVPQIRPLIDTVHYKDFTYLSILNCVAVTDATLCAVHCSVWGHRPVRCVHRRRPPWWRRPQSQCCWHEVHSTWWTPRPLYTATSLLVQCYNFTCILTVVSASWCGS